MQGCGAFGIKGSAAPSPTLQQEVASPCRSGISSGKYQLLELVGNNHVVLTPKNKKVEKKKDSKIYPTPNKHVN